MLILPCLSQAEAIIHHQLHVKLSAADGRIQVRDTISLPPQQTPFNFSLNAGLSPAAVDPGVHIDMADEMRSAPELKVYRVTLPQGRSQFTLSYQGNLSAAAAIPGGLPGNRSYLSSDGAIP